MARRSRQIRQIIDHEPLLYSAIQHPNPQLDEWTVRVPAALRTHRDVAGIGDYLGRVVRSVAPPEPPSVPMSFSALDIPYAVGYLDAVWKAATGKHLFVNIDPASLARLTQPCESEEAFNSLMSALADVLGQVVAPGQPGPMQRGALEAVRDHLGGELDEPAADRAASAFATLIRLRQIRVSTQHSDARHRGVAAFEEIGLPFPPASWPDAWNHIAILTMGALDTLREEVHAGLPR